MLLNGFAQMLYAVIYSFTVTAYNRSFKVSRLIQKLLLFFLPLTHSLKTCVDSMQSHSFKAIVFYLLFLLCHILYCQLSAAFLISLTIYQYMSCQKYKKLNFCQTSCSRLISSFHMWSILLQNTNKRNRYSSPQLVSCSSPFLHCLICYKVPPYGDYIKRD